jgi:predicted heme/steroid binding protein
MKMTKISKSCLILIAAVILLWSVPATAQTVKYNFMPGTDFAKYKTYKWVRVPNAQYPNQILDKQIMTSIDAQLALKGLSRTEGEGPDLYLAYQAAVNQEKQWNSYSSGGDMWGYGRWGGWGGYGGGMSTTTTTSSTINIGTLNLDVYDVTSKQQIWRGEATKTLGSGKDPKKVQKNLDKAMAKMLKNYPPPVKKN